MSIAAAASPEQASRRSRKLPPASRAVVREGRNAIILSTIGIGILGLALPIFILQIYDRVLPNNAGTTLLVLVLGLLVALLSDGALRLLRSRVSSWTAARLEHVLRCEALHAIFGRESPGTYLESINAITTLRDFETNQRIEIRVDLCFAVLYLGLIAYLGTWLVIVPLALLLTFGGTALVIGRMLHASVSRRMDVDETRYDYLLKLLRGMTTVKAMALNGLMMRRHEVLQEQSSLAVQNVMFQSALAQAAAVLFSQLNTVALLGFGALFVLNGTMSLGALAACTLLSGRALQPIQMAMSVWANFQSIRLAREKVGAIVTLPREGAAANKRPELEGAVALDNVSFRHEPAGPLLLDRLSLSVNPGEIVGIAGAPGAGKTTMLQLILGMVAPQGGVITVDGIDIAEIAPESLRRQAALLPRNAAVFSGTILDNLSSFRVGESVNEALYLAFLLGLDEPIRRLPQGFDTAIESGDVLPTGLRQRIAIVRELVNHPKLILFDDADQGLDQDSRNRLLALLTDLGTRSTIILMSNNPEVLAIAGRCYRLSGGRLIPISETGRARIQEVA
jgi:ATP-binding cassette subfamily C protein LapB